MPTVTVKNPRKAYRTIFPVSGGKAVVPPGGMADVDLTDAEIETEKAAGLSVGDAPAKPAPTPTPELSEESDKFSDMTEQELRDYIETETGDKPHWKASIDTLREKARAI